MTPSNAHGPGREADTSAPTATHLTVALLALIGSGLLILGTLAGYLSAGQHFQHQFALSWSGEHLEIAQGAGQAEPGALRLEKLESGQEALVLTDASAPIMAEHFEQVQLATHDAKARQVLFLWSTTDAPGQVAAAPLSPQPPGRYVAHLKGHPRWRGQVATAGVLFRGPSGGPLTISDLTFVPPPAGPREVVLRLWEHWTTFGDWDLRSINYTAPGPSTDPVPLPLVVAVWVCLSATLYIGTVRWYRARPQPAMLAAILLAGWATLDARWQSELWHKLGSTKAQYAGKTLEEKRLTEADAEVYQFLRQVKERLPATPARVLLMAGDPFTPRERYIAIRTLYYLLPHNAGHPRPFDPKKVRPGDYILLLDNVPGVLLDRNRVAAYHHLIQQVPTEKVLSSPLGALYRVR